VPVNPVIANNTTVQLTAIGTFSDESTQNLTNQVTWSSANIGIATVSNTVGTIGLVRGVSVGNTPVTATFNGIVGSTTVTVSAATVSSITITPVNPTVARGTQVQLIATCNLSDGTTEDCTSQVAWASADKSIASVSTASGTEGLLTGNGAGSTTITWTLNGVSGSTTVTVSNATLTSITVTPVNRTIGTNTAVQLTATGNFSDGTTQDLTTQVSWTSGIPAVAEVSNAAESKGLVTGLAVGSTPITAALNSVEGSTTVTVTAATVTSITIAPANPSIVNGTTTQLGAVCGLSDGTTQDCTNQVCWTSGNPAVAEVSEGLVTGTGPGSTTIGATLGGVSGSTDVNVSAAIVTAIKVVPSNRTITKGATAHLFAIANLSDGTLQDVTLSAFWQSSDSGVATVGSTGNNHGLVTGTGAGSVTITATYGGHSSTATVTVTLGPEFAYVTNDTDNTVSVFSVGANGALTPIAGSPFPNPGTGAASVASDTAGKFLYTANQFGATGNSVTAYFITQIGPNRGTLTPVNPPNPVPSGAGAFSVTVDPSGHFAYVGNVGNNTVSGFGIDPGTGALSPVPTSPFSGLPATGLQGVAVSPTDQFLYGAASGTNQVVLFPVDSTTGILNVAGRMLFSPSNPINDPVSVTLDPLGRFAYTANNTLPGAGQGPGNVSVYMVDPSNGALTWVENTANIGIPGAGPSMVAVDPSGRFAYVSGGGLVTAFTIDQTTGALTPTNPPTFAAGLNTLWVAVDPNDKFVYAANHGDFSSGTTPGSVSAYTIDSATGALTPISGSPFPLPKGPTSITVVAVP
jgi:6-phosphogluconolactonase (cycloisomerase 2 family)